jgi:lipopolysaccharide/colanic/teichoic acid biosynthesis glycosyltransferase
VQMMHTSNSPFTRPSLIGSLRFQTFFILAVGIGGAIGVFLAANYALGRGGYILGMLGAPAIQNSLYVAVGSALALIMILRRMESYPGVMINQHVLPTLVATYAVALSLLMFFRVEYSSGLLLACFTGTLATRYLISALARRAPQQLFLIVPGGRVSDVDWPDNLMTQMLIDPASVKLAQASLIADLHHEYANDWERYLAEAAISGTPVYHYKQVWEAMSGKVQIGHLSENIFGALIPSLVYRKVKRLLDMVSSLLVIAPLALLFVAIGIFIKLDSPGPVFFRQRRMGHRGEVFHVLKFRTMRAAGEDDSAALAITQDEDERITRVGAFLRRSRIDELPQVVNILRGEMSWIGPRPEAVSLSREYEAVIPFYRYRHIVRPGISGWAQVNQGHVTELGAIDTKLQYDFYYIKNFSYWIDLLILARTIKVMINGFGAK